MSAQKIVTGETIYLGDDRHTFVVAVHLDTEWTTWSAGVDGISAHAEGSSEAALLALRNKAQKFVELVDATLKGEPVEAPLCGMDLCPKSCTHQNPCPRRIA